MQEFHFALVIGIDLAAVTAILFGFIVCPKLGLGMENAKLLPVCSGTPAKPLPFRAFG